MRMNWGAGHEGLVKETEMTNQDPAARRAAFFAKKAAEAKAAADKKRKAELARQFRLDQFYRDEQTRNASNG